MLHQLSQLSLPAVRSRYLAKKGWNEGPGMQRYGEHLRRGPVVYVCAHPGGHLL